MKITSQQTSATDFSSLLSGTGGSDGHGLKLGRYSEQQESTPILSARTSTSSATTSDVFATDILDTLQSAQTASNAGALLASGTAADLQTALADTIDSVRKNHGNAAATAVMGIIIKGVGDGSGGEDALGNALVSSLKFTDRNFGIAAGDAAINQYNGALNNAVNDYFQNGSNETFYASDGTTDTTDDVQEVVSSTLASITEQFGSSTADTVSDILASSLDKYGNDRQGLSAALTAVDAYLKDIFGEDAGFDATAQPGAQTNLAKGTVVDMAV